MAKQPYCEKDNEPACKTQRIRVRCSLIDIWLFAVVLLGLATRPSPGALIAGPSFNLAKLTNNQTETTIGTRLFRLRHP